MHATEFNSEMFHSIITGIASVMCGLLVFFLKNLFAKMTKLDQIMYKMQTKLAVISARLENIEKELERVKDGVGDQRNF